MIVFQLNGMLSTIKVSQVFEHTERELSYITNEQLLNLNSKESLRIGLILEACFISMTNEVSGILVSLVDARYHHVGINDFWSHNKNLVTSH